MQVDKQSAKGSGLEWGSAGLLHVGGMHVLCQTLREHSGLATITSDRAQERVKEEHMKQIRSVDARGCKRRTLDTEVINVAVATQRPPLGMQCHDSYY